MRRSSRRACDACRRRKTKCDLDPSLSTAAATVISCPACQTFATPCTFNDAPQKRGPKVPRPSQPDSAGLSSIGSRNGLTPASNFESLHIPRQIRQQLIDGIHQQLPSHLLDDVVDQCISLFMEHRFPATPICHEATLRQNTSLLLSDSGHPTSREQQDSLPRIRAFTLLTALCALTLYTLPPDTLPRSQHIAPLFLDASRRMLALHHETEIERPDWQTITIWILQGSTLYTIGHTRIGWYNLAQLRWAVFELRLYDDKTLERYDPLSAQILRHQFSLIYIADKGLGILGDKPIGLHELPLQRPITVECVNKDGLYHLLDARREYNLPVFEEQLMGGFAMVRKLWSAAGQVLFAIKVMTNPEIMAGSSSSISSGGGGRVSGAGLARAQDLYLSFLNVLDNLPPWLQDPDLIKTSHPAAFAYQAPRFWGQRADLLISFHCLRLALLQLCIEHDALQVLGLSNDPLMLELRKSELAQEFLGVVEVLPFKALQANGEACVERIRRVGMVLLELIQNSGNSHVRKRANACFARLLDILSRLDSRVSDMLSVELAEPGAVGA